MSNIYSKISETLSPLGYPVKEQGSYRKDEMLPETFLTYQVLDAPNGGHADNLPGSTKWRIQLVLYSQKPLVVQNADDTLKGLLLPAGFLRAGGRPLPLNFSTGHYGFSSDYRFYEREA